MSLYKSVGISIWPSTESKPSQCAACPLPGLNSSNSFLSFLLPGYINNLDRWFTVKIYLHDWLWQPLPNHWYGLGLYFLLFVLILISWRYRLLNRCCDSRRRFSYFGLCWCICWSRLYQLWIWLLLLRNIFYKWRRFQRELRRLRLEWKSLRWLLKLYRGTC